jgi:SAM-dependent methyltransferase
MIKWPADAYKVRDTETPTSQEEKRRSFTRHNEKYVEGSNAQTTLEYQENDYKAIDDLKADPGRISIVNAHRFPHLKVAVDIGSGYGWLAEYLMLNRDYRKVIAIEPSGVALDFAKKHCSRNTTGELRWVQGFAEEVLSSSEFVEEMKSLGEPVHFCSSFVLTHLCNDVVEAICEAIHSSAPPGSIVSLEEVWTKKTNYQQAEFCWYGRSIYWWAQRFPDWNISIQNAPRAPRALPFPVEQYKGMTFAKPKRAKLEDT